MTNSAHAIPPELKGAERPRILWLPEHVSSAGLEAVELARMAGLVLDPWEEFILVNALNERSDGKWAAFEVGLNAPRQNGKNAVLEARELAGLFLLGERLIVHSAHQLDTSLEAMERLIFLVENTPDFSRRLKRGGIRRTHGEEGIALKSGQRIRFRTRTKRGGRGFSGDCLIYDEAMEIYEAAHGALLPTLSARPNPQVWYTGSAVDQTVHENGVVFARVRERALERNDPALAYFEFSVPVDVADVTKEMATDPGAWAQGNPGLGIRITAEHIAREQRSMDARTFAVERLGAGDWPATDESADELIAEATWQKRADTSSRIVDPICFAIDVTPDRSAAAIGAGGKREDGLYGIEVVEHKRGTGWVVKRLLELIAAHRPDAVVLDAAGPAAALLPDLLAAQVDVKPVSAKEHAQACGIFYDAVDQDVLRHLDTPELAAAIAGAATRPLGEAWAWSRKSSAIDISPLVACTLALWAHATYGPKTKEPLIAWGR